MTANYSHSENVIPMISIKSDCKYFRGDIPCKPHKAHGYHCDNCPEYKKITNKILIIKLAAIGDVIRSTPLLRKLKKEHPDSMIVWLTYFPEVLSYNFVDRKLAVNIENTELIKNIHFDHAINLDKDPLAISLMNSINATTKNGFTIDEFGHCKPYNSDAEIHKWITGLFDDQNKLNTKHYVREIFEIAGYSFDGEEYILEDNLENIQWDLDYNKTIAGLNTGCGKRWLSRLWPEKYWIKLADQLLNKGYEVVLLGGPDEHDKNQRIAKKSGAKYFGHFDLQTFINEVNQVDIVVSAVTMATHIAIGLKKQLILFNNIFNKNEFYLYNKGVILEPEIDCDCYFTDKCPNDCMQYLYPETVLKAIDNQKNHINKLDK